MLHHGHRGIVRAFYSIVFIKYYLHFRMWTGMLTPVPFRKMQSCCIAIHRNFCDRLRAASARRICSMCPPLRDDETPLGMLDNQVNAITTTQA